jgi:hypothetical protein
MTELTPDEENPLDELQSADAAVRFSDAKPAHDFARESPTPARVVFVPDKMAYGHYWVVSVEDAQTLEQRGYKIVDAEGRPMKFVVRFLVAAVVVIVVIAVGAAVFALFIR